MSPRFKLTAKPAVDCATTARAPARTGEAKEPPACLTHSAPLLCALSFF